MNYHIILANCQTYTPHQVTRIYSALQPSYHLISHIYQHPRCLTLHISNPDIGTVELVRFPVHLELLSTRDDGMLIGIGSNRQIRMLWSWSKAKTQRRLLIFVSFIRSTFSATMIYGKGNWFLHLLQGLGSQNNVIHKVPMVWNL